MWFLKQVLHFEFISVSIDKAVLPDLEDTCSHDEVLQQAGGPEQFSERDCDAHISHQNGSAGQSSFPENMSCPAPADNSSDQPSPSSLLDNLSITDETSDTLGVNSSLSTEGRNVLPIFILFTNCVCDCKIKTISI